MAKAGKNRRKAQLKGQPTLSASAFVMAWSSGVDSLMASSGNGPIAATRCGSQPRLWLDSRGRWHELPRQILQGCNAERTRRSAQRPGLHRELRLLARRCHAGRLVLHHHRRRLGNMRGRGLSRRTPWLGSRMPRRMHVHGSLVRRQRNVTWDIRNGPPRQSFGP